MLLLVMDGLGGYRSKSDPSELAAARTPNLDHLASEGSLGLHDPVRRGITAGSGAGHLGLFGYDPLEYEIGRGGLSAAGIGFELQAGDVAARVNLCRLAEDGTIADRRAGRLPTEEARALCADLAAGLRLPGVEVFVEVEREHRALLVLRGPGLRPELDDTDPQREGMLPLAPRARIPEAELTAQVIATLLDQAREILAGRSPANFLLLRGFETQRAMPSFADRYRVRPLAVATYPMYLGIARLLGFDTVQIEGGVAEQVAALPALLPGHDFVFLHVKASDSAGEDGDVARKITAIEAVDAQIPALLAMGIDVVAVTGDHATPARLAAHSWHPVPVLLWGGTAAADGEAAFDESACRRGSLGRFDARELMPQVLAAAGRLAKYGA